MKKIIRSVFLLSRAKQIALGVALAHFVLIFFLACHHFATRKWRPSRPIAIQTISFSEPAETGGGVAVSPDIKKTPPPPALKKEKRSVEKSIAALKKSDSPKQPKRNEKAEIFKQMAESFDVIALPPSKISSRPSLNIPIKKEDSIKKTEEKAEDHAIYEEYLVSFLQSALNLPEYGDVKMEIEIDALGKIVNCRILESKSAKNAKFLREEIEGLHFPIPFERRETHKYTIVFRNK